MSPTRSLTDPSDSEKRILRTLLSLDREGRLRPPATSPELTLIERTVGLKRMEPGEGARLATAWRKEHFERPPKLLVDAELNWTATEVEWSFLLRGGYVEERQPEPADVSSWPKCQLADYKRQGERVWAFPWSPYIRSDGKVIFCVASLTEPEAGMAWTGLIETFVDGELADQRVLYPGAYFPHVSCELTAKGREALVEDLADPEIAQAETKAQGKSRSREELNHELRNLVKKFGDSFNRRQAAELLGCGEGTVSNLPVWKTMMERRRKVGKPKTPYGISRPDMELADVDELIAGQDADRRETGHGYEEPGDAPRHRFTKRRPA